MPKQKGLFAYEERYQTLYNAGVTFWNEHEQHPMLRELLDELDKEAECIEAGCGEGFEARAIAAYGYKVVAIDLSPTVIEKAKKCTADELQIDYVVGDVTDLQSVCLRDNRFSLAVNVGCLHMMHEKEDRIAHLKEVRRVLKPDGIFFLQNGLELDDVEPKTPEEVEILNNLKKVQADYKRGKEVVRKIQTEKGEKEILLPLCPGGKTLTLRQYEQELQCAGFKVLRSKKSGGANMPFEAVIVARASKDEIYD